LSENLSRFAWRLQRIPDQNWVQIAFEIILLGFELAWRNGTNGTNRTNGIEYCKPRPSGTSGRLKVLSVTELGMVGLLMLVWVCYRAGDGGSAGVGLLQSWGWWVS
jgi:hypothetical protein